MRVAPRPSFRAAFLASLVTPQARSPRLFPPKRRVRSASSARAASRSRALVFSPSPPFRVGTREAQAHPRGGAAVVHVLDGHGGVHRGRADRGQLIFFLPMYSEASGVRGVPHTRDSWALYVYSSCRAFRLHELRSIGASTRRARASGTPCVPHSNDAKRVQGEVRRRGRCAATGTPTGGGGGGGFAARNELARRWRTRGRRSDERGGHRPTRGQELPSPLITRTPALNRNTCLSRPVRTLRIGQRMFNTDLAPARRCVSRHSGLPPA